MAEPVSTCDWCGQNDDHPKHVVQVPGQETDYGTIYHRLDKDRDGWLRFHFDCEHDGQENLDPHHVAAAQSGTHGNKLRQLIKGER